MKIPKASSSVPRKRVGAIWLDFTAVSWALRKKRQRVPQTQHPHPPRLAFSARPEAKTKSKAEKAEVEEKGPKNVEKEPEKEPEVKAEIDPKESAETPDLQLPGLPAYASARPTWQQCQA